MQTSGNNLMTSAASNSSGLTCLWAGFSLPKATWLGERGCRVALTALKKHVLLCTVLGLRGSKEGRDVPVFPLRPPQGQQDLSPRSREIEGTQQLACLCPRAGRTQTFTCCKGSSTSVRSKDPSPSPSLRGRGCSTLVPRGPAAGSNGIGLPVAN